MSLTYTHHLSSVACNDSSLVEEAWYNDDLNELMIKLHGATEVFIYGNVSLGEWNMFVESESLGRHYNKYIKGSYHSVRSFSQPTLQSRKSFRNGPSASNAQTVLNDNESRFTVVAEVVKMVSKEIVATDVTEAVAKFNQFIGPWSDEESVKITVREVTQHFND